MSKPESEPTHLRREDWDFSQVPDHELETCFLWEYGREWGEFSEYAKYVGAPDDDLNFSHPEALKISMAGYDLQKAWNIRGANMLLEMLVFSGIDTYTGAADSAPPQPDKPWQCFDQSSRDLFVDRYNPGVKQIGSALLRDYEKMTEAGGYEPFETYVAFRVNWDETDNRLISDFSRWLKQTRVNAARENRGRSTRDKLKMLGAMRLLHHNTLSAAVTISTNTLGSPLYRERPSWERARKGALKAYQESFFINCDPRSQPPVPKSFPKYSGPTQMIASTHPDGI